MTVQLKGAKIVSAKKDRIQLVVPGIESCSWITNLVLEITAAKQTGKEACPPVPMTICGFSSRRIL